MNEKPRRTNPECASLDAYIQKRTKVDPEFEKRKTDAFDQIQIARLVKSEREARRFSQSDLAALAGTKQPAIARLESGRVIPRLDLLQKIAHALGLRLTVAFEKLEP